MVRTWLDAMAVDGSSDLFSASLFESSTNKLKYFGILVTITGIALNIFSSVIYKKITAYILSLKKELSEISEQIVSEFKSFSPIYLYALLLIFLIGFWIRFRFLGLVIRYDESFTYINYASRNPIVTYILYDIVNNHVLHSLLVNLATRLFGSSEFVIRIPAFAASIATIPLIFVFGRMLFGKYSSGLLAATLFAFGGYMIEYGINARGYSMISFFSVALWIATWITIRNPKNMAGWTLFALSSVAGMATNPAMFYSIAITSVWYFISGNLKDISATFRKTIPLISSLAISVMLTLLWYLPGLLLFGLKPFTDHGVGNNSVLIWWDSYAKFIIELFYKTNAFLPGYAVVTIAVAFLIGLARVPKFGVSLLAIPLLMFIQRIAPPTRGVIYICIIYYLISSGGLTIILEPLRKISQRIFRLSATGVALLLCGMMISPVLKENCPPDLDEMYVFPEAPQVTRFLEGKIGPQAPVLTFVPCDSPLIFYAREFGMPYNYIISTGLIKYRPEAFWLVTDDRGEKTTLQRLMTQNDLKGMGFGEPELKKDFGKVKVYYLK